MAKPHQFPIFELDEASRPMFATSSHEGRAQYHFVFAPQGINETIALWARLVQSNRRSKTNFLRHQVALWPQGAEAGRVFFAFCNKNEFSEDFSDTFDFDWANWQNRFKGNGGALERYWATTEAGQRRLLSFGTDGRANAISSLLFRGFGFDCHVRDKETPHCMQTLRFLQMSNDDFHKQMLVEWNNPQSPIRFESDWREFPNEERDAIAFECEHGEWDEFIRLVRLVLVARLGNENLYTGRVVWNFCYCPIDIYDDAQKTVLSENDPFLLCWRTVLLDFFRPRYARFIGLVETIPACIENHLNRHPRQKIVVQPSQHEVLEARIELKEWAHGHIDIHSANVLMALL